jgi:predicted Zn-dependent protease
MQASALVRAGKVDQAEALLRSALADDPHSATLHGTLGKLLLKEHKYEDSTMELRQAAQEDPESPEYNLMAAAALIGWKRYVIAVDFLRALQPRFGNHPEFHYYLGVAYYYESDMNAAVTQLEEAVRLSPQLERAQFLLANCLLVRGQSARALNIFRTLAKDHPDNAFYWATLGAKLGHVDAGGGPEESLNAVRHALALAPNDSYVQFAAATVFSETGNYGSARPLLEQLENVAPKRPDVHALLVQVYARLGERELAQKETRIVDQLQKEAAAPQSATPPGDSGSDPQQP